MQTLRTYVRRFLSPFNSPIRELLVYMRILREEGADNKILRRLAQPQKVQDFVGFLVETSAPLQEVVDTIIVSDIHLGSKHSLAGALRKALSGFSFKRLILNGDIFDHLEFDPEHITLALSGKPSTFFNEDHAELIRYLHLISHSHEVVWVKGNHDEEHTKLVNAFTNVAMHEEYRWNFGGKSYLALHGDQFDLFTKERPILTAIGSNFYAFVQWLGPWTRNFCTFLKRETKWYTNALKLVTEGALSHAKAREVDYILCGHTHQVHYRKEQSVHYYNSGGWTEAPGHLVTVGTFGVRIHAFNQSGDYVGSLSPYA